MGSEIFLFFGLFHSLMRDDRGCGNHDQDNAEQKQRQDPRPRDVADDPARPAVRERTVWGGVLVPYDSIWRTGANEATHLATSKTIVLGDVTLAPGLYTLWTQHTRNGTYLIVNKQVGQWGTEYHAEHDIGRVKMDMAKTPEHVEDFTITIRPAGPSRGAIDFAWGDSVATATFTVQR